MGTPYATAVGAMPNPASKAWLNFVGRLINYRQAECPLARTTTYYFSTSGSDANSGLTPALAKKSINAANVLLATAGSIAVLFRRDDVWRFVVAGASPNQHLQNNSLNSGGIVVTSAHKTVGTYTDETATGTSHNRPPIFTPFVAISNASWALDGVLTNSYKMTLAAATGASNNVAALREALEVNPTRVLSRVGSAAVVNTTPGSYYYDAAGTTLWLRPFANSADPTAGWHPGYEYCPQFKASDFATITYDGVAAYKDCGPGVFVSDVDDVRIDGLRFDGFLPSFNDTNAAGWLYGCAVEAEISGTNACLVTNCEGYFSGSHIFFKGGAHGSSGGIFTCVNCRAGMQMAVDIAASRQAQDQFMSYHPGGGNEGLFVDCRSTVGRLPSTTYADVTLQGAVFQVHSDGTNGHQAGLFLAVGHEIEPNFFQPFNSGDLHDLPNWITGNLTGAGVTGTPGDMSNCRAFYLGCKFPVRAANPTDLTWWSGAAQVVAGVTAPAQASAAIFINSELETRALRTDTNPAFPFTGSARPAMINCLWDVDLGTSGASPGNFQMDTNACRLYFSRIRFKQSYHSGTGGPNFELNGAYGGNNVWASAAQGVIAKGTIFELTGCPTPNSSYYAGLTNNLDSGGSPVAAGLETEHTNAYVGGWTSKGTATDYWGFCNCPSYVTAPRVEMFPSPSSVLVVSSLPVIETVALEYDKLCNDRTGTANTIGPVAALDGVKRFSGVSNGGIFRS